MESESEVKEAVAAFQSGDLDRAREAAESALKSAPSPQLHHLLGLIHCRQGNPAAGIDHQRTARERGTIVTPTYDQVTEPLTARPVGRWKRYRKQLEPVLPVLLPWAERLGYSD